MTLATSNDHKSVSSPKPSYLRRLDSPDTHHGKLMRSKQQLTTMLSRALQNVPRMKLSAYHEIEDLFSTAVSELESGTVDP
jgi:hypothetical protein